MVFSKTNMSRFRNNRFQACQVFFILILLLKGNWSSAQDQISFQDMVLKVGAAREKIGTYDVSIFGHSDDEAQPINLSNGGTVVPTAKQVAFELELVADYRNQLFLAARRNRLEDLKTHARTTEDWNVVAERTTKDGKLVRTLLKPSKEYPRYFDPLALGIAFEFELHHGDHWQKIRDNYLKWGEAPPFAHVEGGIYRYTSQSADLIIEIDTAKDYWPIKMVRNGGSKWETETTLEKTEGYWLPKSARVKTKGLESRYIFKWHTVNKDVSDRFQSDSVRSKFNVEFQSTLK